MSSPSVQKFANKDQLGAAVSALICELSNQAIAEKKSFSVAFSGGSLPKIVASGLTAGTDKTDYSKWQVFFSDELSGLERKNIHTIDETLVNDPAKAAAAYQTNLLKVLSTASPSPSPSPSTTSSSSDSKIEKTPSPTAASASPSSIPSLDLLLLGMGPDGHTCSLFPDHKLLTETSLLIAPITDSPKPPSHRITFTLPLVLRAKHIVFVCAGDSKQDALVRVLKKGELPSGIVTSQAVHKENVRWFVDNGAASKL